MFSGQIASYSVYDVASSYFISASFVLAFHSEKMNYAYLVQWISPFNEFFRVTLEGVGLDLSSKVALLSLSAEVSR